MAIIKICVSKQLGEIDSVEEQLTDKPSKTFNFEEKAPVQLKEEEDSETESVEDLIGQMKSFFDLRRKEDLDKMEKCVKHLAEICKEKKRKEWGKKANNQSSKRKYFF